jgi:HPt (histidine-containing phosphotransfer) domain-containing protein
MNATANGNEFPIFDGAQIEMLRRDLGAATMRDLLAQCVATMDAQLSEIRRSTSAGDHVTAKRIAHDLKGVCAQFGATRASEIAKRIELEMDDAAAIATLMPALADSITGAGAKIREMTVQI